MTKYTLRPSVRPTLEPLEDRCTPAGTVTGSLTNHVWKLTGDDAANLINLGSTEVRGAFTLAGTTTIAGVTNPKGVHKIVFDMKGGNDDVLVNVARLTSMVFQGGDGNNKLTATNFRLATGFQVVNGVGLDFITLNNFRIGGNVNIDNGAGGSGTDMYSLSAAAGFNNIAGNVNINNGAGYDTTTIGDTNFGGNITVNNGAGDGANAGYFQLYNNYQTGRTVVGGNISVTFQDGNVSYNGIWDAVVRGSVLFNNGSGASENIFDGYKTPLPVVIQARLKIVGTGATLVSIGRDTKNTGLRVGQNLVIDVVKPTDLTLQTFNLIVNGQTKII